MSNQAMPYARRPKRLGLHAALAVAVTGAALAIPVDAAVAMPTDYVKQVKADSGDTLTLDGNTDTVTVKDPEHGVTGVLNKHKPGPVPSRMDTNGTYTLTFPKPAAQADATPKVVYKHDGKTVKTFALPHGPG
ncbi:hypothetical protein SAMN06272775_4848 [Streptomyces sp. 2323.1]|uniref:hypothetical protein n=1 Tax=Streptomyces sp. 2323.1 TaxID=1938841 RepID=UPI000BB7C256|nr:hypothetical protein [Streptomyces sp. 2323.1]SOE13879.1 hypothetical protein SAMN06272775_4848 [Streptomyces sp. 2323.1]